MPHAWSSSVEQVLILLGTAILIAAALRDFTVRSIPNWMAASLCVLGLVLRLLDGAIVAGLIAGAVVFLITLVCWLRGWLGGGDVKLMTAVAIVLPPASVPTFFVCMSVAGAIHALIYLAARRILPAPSLRRPHTIVGRALRVESRRIQRGGPLPYVCAITVGFLFVTL